MSFSQMPEDEKEPCHKVVLQCLMKIHSQSAYVKTNIMKTLTWQNVWNC